MVVRSTIIVARLGALAESVFALVSCGSPEDDKLSLQDRCDHQKAINASIGHHQCPAIGLGQRRGGRAMNVGGFVHVASIGSVDEQHCEELLTPGILWFLF